MATECTQESILKFLIERGGHVRNTELTDHFKGFLTEESFTQLVDNIAYSKQEDGQKVVCLRDRFSGMKDGEHRSEVGDSSSGRENIVRPEGNEESKKVSDLCVSDIALAGVTDGFSQEAEKTGHGSENNGKAGELERDAFEGTSCPIFTKSVSDAEQEAAACRGRLVGRRRTSRGSQRSLLGASNDVDLGADASTPRASRRSFVELMMSSSPQVRRSLVRRHSQGHMAPRRQDSLRSNGESGSAEEEHTSVTLDPLEHEWMMCASDGEWDSLQRLLVCEPGLISKKDFVTGFTCLHWAAKQGKHELLALLVTFAQQRSMAVNVNARTSAGYTPLHLAAMHNHVEVMKLLVGAYDADLEARDYSGRKPSQYLSPSVAGDIQEIVGACGDSDAGTAEGGAGRWRFPKVLQSNLNPLRLLNLPEEPVANSPTKPISLYRKASIGRIKLNKGRVRTQIVHSTSFRETEEGGGSIKSPVKSRPVSNLFG